MMAHVVRCGVPVTALTALPTAVLRPSEFTDRAATPDRHAWPTHPLPLRALLVTNPSALAVAKATLMVVLRGVGEVSRQIEEHSSSSGSASCSAVRWCGGAVKERRAGHRSINRNCLRYTEPPTAPPLQHPHHTPHTPGRTIHTYLQEDLQPDHLRNHEVGGISSSTGLRQSCPSNSKVKPFDETRQGRHFQVQMLMFTSHV